MRKPTLLLPFKKNQSTRKRRRASWRNTEQLEVQSERDGLADHTNIRGSKSFSRRVRYTASPSSASAHSPGCGGLPMEGARNSLAQAWFLIMGTHLANRQHIRKCQQVNAPPKDSPSSKTKGTGVLIPQLPPFSGGKTLRFRSLDRTPYVRLLAFPVSPPQVPPKEPHSCSHPCLSREPNPRST